MSIKVVLADDHAIVRDGLRALLEAKPGISVVGDASDGKQVLSQVNELQPDIVVMDILMPELNGIEATKRILESSPQVRVIILSMLGTADHVFRAVQAGVRGFLLKESAGREVVDAVEAVYSGDMYFSRPITNTLVNDYMQMRQETEADTIEKLSLRENEILCLVVEGKTSAEIGRDLHLSPKTVESYRSRIMQKLGVSDLSELIKYAIKHGLISLD
jgi:DNA-binding NarL/FixJ family response regulator